MMRGQRSDAMVKTRKTKFRQISKEKYSKLTLVQRVDYIAEMMLDIRQKVEETRQALQSRRIIHKRT